MATGTQRELSESPLPGRVAGAASASRRLLRRLPRAAWVCALVAVLNAMAWSLITPAFEVPDEQSHYAYTEYLVQHGKPPAQRSQTDTLSSNEEAARVGLDAESIQFNPPNGTIWSATERRELDRLLARYTERGNGNGAAAEVGGEPPLYYALQAVPYLVATGGSPLDRILLMRLLSALLAGVTILFVYLFLREALPSTPWAWAVGALGAALQPLFGFMSGGVNSDALLYAASAASFYLLARAFRRGLTRPLALATGGVLAVGLMTKFNAFGLLPGVVLALWVLAIRREGGVRLRTLELPGVALGVALMPVLLEMALNATVWDRPLVGATSGNFATGGADRSLGDVATYLWQFYLVPLPGMRHDLTIGFPFRDLWLNGFVGSFGYFDTRFPGWVYDIALAVFAVVVVLVARALLLRRKGVRARRLELGAYAVTAVVLMLFVAVASYLVFSRSGASVAQARYLLPLLALYGAALALAARGVGPRWAPVAGAAIVLLALAHDVFSQLLVISRYYA